MNAKQLLAFGVLIAALTFPSAAALADEATLQGRVVTPDGQTPIKNLPVIIRGSAGSVVATTDEDGRYAVHTLPPGDYVVVPANEPELRKEIIIERSRRPWEIWKRDTGKSVTVDDIHLPAGRRY